MIEQLSRFFNQETMDQLKRTLGRELIGLAFFYLLATLLQPQMVNEYYRLTLMRADWMELLGNLSFFLFLNVYLIARGLTVLMPGYGALAALLIGVLFRSPTLAAGLLAVVYVVPHAWNRYTGTASGKRLSSWWEARGLTVTLYALVMIGGALLITIAVIM